MSANPSADVDWVPWRVATTSGFEVAVPRGRTQDGDQTRVGGVGVVQINETQFDVCSTFRYSNDAVERDLVERLVRGGTPEREARAAVDDARTYVPREDDPTDLASVPRFLRWFENPYGRHSLAALIHDELISGVADSGALRSDVLADRFFREMMRTSGVPWLKRWIMWSAVALRTRFVAGGLRQASVVAWLVLSVVGISCAVAATGSALLNWSWPPVSPAWLFAGAVALIPVGAALWGKQCGASLVAAVAALWIVPAALAAGVAWVVYLALERVAAAVGVGSSEVTRHRRTPAAVGPAVVRGGGRQSAAASAVTS